MTPFRSYALEWIACAVLLFAAHETMGTDGGVLGTSTHSQRDASSDEGWPQWRGPKRDGIAKWLPKSIESPKQKWKYPLGNLGVGGVAANEDFVVVSSRDGNDERDQFVCLDFETGLPLWTFAYEALGKLDYGNSPRATPLLADPYVITLGAFGDLCCLDIETGKTVWRKNLQKDFGGKLPIWGYTASPLFHDGKLVVQPGGTKHGIIALKIETGELIWSCEGRTAAYASPIVVERDRKKQVVAFDEVSLGGWDLLSGAKLWELKPKVDSDFNVPSPIAMESGVVLMSENNATRLHLFGRDAILQSEIEASFDELAADSHTPVLLGNRLIGVHDELFVLDVKDGLKPSGKLEGVHFGTYCSLIGCENRVLALALDGEAYLIQIDLKVPKILGRWKTLEEKGQILAHPAMVDRTFLVRGPDSLVAWDLSEK